MVCPPCSWYEAHPQLRQQECLLYSLLHPSLSLCSLSSSYIPLNSNQSSKFDRRRGFSNRATAAVFVATIINFLLFSLATGNEVATLVVFIRTALNLDIDYPLSEKPELVNNALRNVNIVKYWATTFPVSIRLRCRILYLFMLGGDISQRSHCHLEGLGPLPGPTVGNPHTVYCTISINSPGL